MPPTDRPYGVQYEQYLILYTNGDKPGQCWLTVSALNEKDALERFRQARPNMTPTNIYKHVAKIERSVEYNIIHS